MAPATDLRLLRALAHPVRRGLYELLAAAPRPLGRDEAAEAVEISRSLAAYHLDALVELGLAEASFERRGERRGPGAGRPAKLYRRAEQEFVVRVPPRDYRLLSELLARAAEADEAGVVGEALVRVAREAGREMGEEERQRAPAEEHPHDLLRLRGYEPFDDEGVTRLRNCPFDAVASRYPDTVCRLNLALIEGILDSVEVRTWRATLEPRAGSCCVALRRRD